MPASLRLLGITTVDAPQDQSEAFALADRADDGGLVGTRRIERVARES